MSGGFQIYVDSALGNDGTGTPQNQNLPYATVQAGINAAAAQIAIVGGQWVIQIAPGTYSEASGIIVIPVITTPNAGINITGQGATSTILTSVLDVSSSTLLENFTVFNFVSNPAAQAALTVRNGATVNLVFANLLSNVLVPLISQVAVNVDVIDGQVNFSRSGNFLTVSAAVPTAYLNRIIKGEINVQVNQDEFDIKNSGVKRAVMYYVTGIGSKLQVSQNVGKMVSPTSVLNNILIETESNATALIAASRIGMTTSGTQLNNNILASAKGTSSIDVSVSRVEMLGLPPGTFIAASGDVTATSSIKLLNNAFVSSEMGSIVGKFANISWGITTQNGTYNTNGTISDKLIFIDTPITYSVSPNDRSIVVTNKNAIISLPDPVFLVNILNIKGQDLFISNYSSKTIRIIGAFLNNNNKDSNEDSNELDNNDNNKNSNKGIDLKSNKGVFLKNSINGWVIMLGN